MIYVGVDSSGTNKVNSALDDLIAKEKKLGQEVRNTNKDFQAQGSKVDDIMNGIGMKIAGAFSIAAVVGFTKAVFDTTAMFQKFEAQLTTALGSRGAAVSAMERLTKFAAETPFSVQEITSSFVRLANRGIQPSNESLKKLGDMASALGKPLQQVIEAILDINNTERWTELGVKVKTTGQTITGTFKGMKVEMARTEGGAMAMIEKFGEMKSVAGGMEMQMETLGGKMSNVNDNWERLLNNIGKQTTGIFAGIMNQINESLGGLNSYLEAVAKIEKMGIKVPTKWEQWVSDYGGLFNEKGLREEAGNLQYRMDELSGLVAKKEENLSKNQVDKTTLYTEQINAEKDVTKQNALQVKYKEELKENSKLEMVALNKGLSKQALLVELSFKAGQITEKDKNKELSLIQKVREAEMAKHKASLTAIDELTLKVKPIAPKTPEQIKADSDKAIAQIKKEIDILDGLIKKLRDLKITEEELIAGELKGEEKSDALFKLKQTRINNDYLDQKKKITEEIHNKTMLNKALILLEKIKTQEIKNLTISHDKDIKQIREQEAREEIEHRNRIVNMQIELKKQQGETDSELHRYNIEELKKYYDEKIKVETDAKKKEELILEQKIKIGSAEENNKKRLESMNKSLESEEERHTIEMLRLNGASEKEILQQEYDYAKERLDKLKEDTQTKQDVLLKATNEEIELSRKLNDFKIKSTEDANRKLIASMKELLQASLDAMVTKIEAEIAGNNVRITNEDKIIETQRILAQKGYENNLAFEERRRDDLTKQQIAQQKKLQKIKELEIFLNALAKFVEENPKTALSKALGLIASTKAAETLFAEEGGIVGQSMTKANGRTHKSGRDRLVIAEQGEGILSIEDMNRVGTSFGGFNQFRNFLKNPFKEKMIPNKNINLFDNSLVVKEIQELKDIVKNKKELSVDWEGLDLRMASMENGIKETTKIKRLGI